MKFHIKNLSKFPSIVDLEAVSAVCLLNLLPYVYCAKSVITRENYEVTLLLLLSALLCNFGKENVNIAFTFEA
jgi:hypothetical protein